MTVLKRLLLFASIVACGTCARAESCVSFPYGQEEDFCTSTTIQLKQSPAHELDCLARRSAILLENNLLLNESSQGEHARAFFVKLISCLSNQQDVRARVLGIELHRLCIHRLGNYARSSVADRDPQELQQRIRFVLDFARTLPRPSDEALVEMLRSRIAPALVIASTPDETRMQVYGVLSEPTIDDLVARLAPHGRPRLLRMDDAKLAMAYSTAFPTDFPIEEFLWYAELLLADEAEDLSAACDFFVQVQKLKAGEQSEAIFNDNVKLMKLTRFTTGELSGEKCLARVNMFFSREPSIVCGMTLAPFTLSNEESVCSDCQYKFGRNVGGFLREDNRNTPNAH